MFKDFVKQQADMQFYPVISLVGFIIFFTALSLRAMLYKKSDMDKMSRIPLDPDDDTMKFDHL